MITAALFYYAGRSNYTCSPLGESYGSLGAASKNSTSTSHSYGGHFDGDAGSDYIGDAENLRRALAPWFAVSVFHVLYVGLTYRGAPEITGCREFEVLKRDSPVVHHIGESVRRYFSGRIIKEAELDPEGTIGRYAAT
jgi:hypothetical protein